MLSSPLVSVPSAHSIPAAEASYTQAATDAGAGEEAVLPRSQPPRKCLLVVDDSPGNIDTLCEILRPHYTVKVATSGLQALQIVESQSPPDLVLLDILMPGLSGYEVCRRIKTSRNRRNIPVMFVTGKDEQEDEELGLSLGASDYITKPVRPPILLARVRTHLELKAASDTLVASSASLQTMLNHLKKSQGDLIQTEKMASLGAVVTGISQDLEPPLGMARMTSETLRHFVQEMELQMHPNDHGRDHDSDRDNLMNDLFSLRRMATLIERSVLQAAALVNGFSMIAMNHTAELRRTFDLRDEVQSVVDVLQSERQGGVWTLNNTVPHGIACDGPPGAYVQILTSLGHNAVRHAFHGRDKGSITISAIVSGEHVKVCVMDDGVGIESISQARIFEPFFNSATGAECSGLGLAVARRIAQIILGGDLHVISVVGHGATFVLNVPLRTPG